LIRRGRGRGKPVGATVSDGRERRFANHLPSLRDATSSVVEPDRARVSRVGTSANRFLGAHEDFGFGGVRRIAADAREGRARDAPATLRSRWRCPPSEGSCALPSAACSGLGTPPAFRASDSNATRAGLQHVAVTNDKSSISYETQSHACICPKDETVRAPISFSFSFLEEDETKGVFRSRRGSRERSRLRLRGRARVALFLFPPERAPHGERADQVDEAQHQKLRLGVPPRGDEREKREKDKETPDDG